MLKRALAVFLALTIGLTAFAAFAHDEPVEIADDPTIATPYTFSANFHWGFLLFSNREFFVLTGARLDTFDFSVGIGMNNGIWMGSHFYFFTDRYLAVYTGFELIRHNDEELLNFTPLFPIGFTFQAGRVNVLIEASIGPALQGEEIAHQFGMGFMMQF